MRIFISFFYYFICLVFCFFHSTIVLVRKFLKRTCCYAGVPHVHAGLLILAFPLLLTIESASAQSPDGGALTQETRSELDKGVSAAATPIPYKDQGIRDIRDRVITNAGAHETSLSSAQRSALAVLKKQKEEDEKKDRNFGQLDTITQLVLNVVLNVPSHLSRQSLTAKPVHKPFRTLRTTVIGALDNRATWFDLTPDRQKLLTSLKTQRDLDLAKDSDLSYTVEDILRERGVLQADVSEVKEKIKKSLPLRLDVFRKHRQAVIDKLKEKKAWFGDDDMPLDEQVYLAQLDMQNNADLAIDEELATPLDSLDDFELNVERILKNREWGGVITSEDMNVLQDYDFQRVVVATKSDMLSRLHDGIEESVTSQMTKGNLARGAAFQLGRGIDAMRKMRRDGSVGIDVGTRVVWGAVTQYQAGWNPWPVLSVNSDGRRGGTGMAISLSPHLIIGMAGSYGQKRDIFDLPNEIPDIGEFYSSLQFKLKTAPVTLSAAEYSGGVFARFSTGSAGYINVGLESDYISGRTENGSFTIVADETYHDSQSRHRKGDFKGTHKAFVVTPSFGGGFDFPTGPWTLSSSFGAYYSVGRILSNQAVTMSHGSDDDVWVDVDTSNAIRVSRKTFYGGHAQFEIRRDFASGYASSYSGMVFSSDLQGKKYSYLPYAGVKAAVRPVNTVSLFMDARMGRKSSSISTGISAEF